MRVAVINTTASSYAGPARVMHSVCRRLSSEGHKVMVAFGRGDFEGDYDADVIKTSSKASVIGHYLLGRLSDSECLHSCRSTRRLLKAIADFNPDIIQLHNLHGHYLHLPTLVEGLRDMDIPVVATLHDCWLMTGHCAFYSHSACSPYASGGCDVSRCPLVGEYPASLISRSRHNYAMKRELLHSLSRLHLVAVSRWVADEAMKSHLYDKPITIISNGVSTERFRPLQREREDMILAVANNWDERKGLRHILSLADRLRPGESIVVVGNIREKIAIPAGVTALGLVESTEKMAELYNRAKVYVNSSSAETFGLTTAEALACGTPVVLNDSHTLPHLLAADGACKVGVAVDVADTQSLRMAIDDASALNRNVCRNYALVNFDENTMATAYIDLYDRLLNPTT